MANHITGLGATLKEYRIQNGEVTIADACRKASERLMGSERLKFELGQLSVGGGSIVQKDSGEVVCAVDELSWGLLAKLLNIPFPYLMRLGVKMRELNVNYWLQSLHDKEVELVVKDGQLLEIKEGVEIEQGDMLELLNRVMPTGIILRASNPTNAVMWDVLDPRRKYDGRYEKWVFGLRVVVKEGLNAPEISPIFVSEESCGTVELAEYFEKLNIKSLNYSDILHLVAERMTDCINFADSMFKLYRNIEEDKLPDARKRIMHYCRENSVPPRVEKYAVSAYDSAGLVNGDFGDIISVFSTLGFYEEVKPSSERKLQKMAGHIITKAHNEDRCDKCDALELEQNG